MKLPSFQLLQAVRSSYWFLPSVMALGAIVLGAVMVWLDAGPLAGVLEPLSWYQASKPEGAREVLSAIAGSMITVAGVVFSITIVAISYAANQYGPRILTNFMSDRGNQVTLGTFIATFVYSVVVLRTIQSGDTDFVPQLAVFVGMLLAFCSIAVLIYFIHHVPQSIHVNHVGAKIGQHLMSSIDRSFPSCFGEPPKQVGAEMKRLERTVEERFGEGAPVVEIDSNSAGYVEAMDQDRLYETACKHDLTLCLVRSPGDFLYKGAPFVLAWPEDRVGDEIADELRKTFTVGSRRTPVQDLLFLIDELVDIGARALSTGINDPYTATTCIDWLTAAAAEMARRQPVSPYRLDKSGELRVVVPTGSFREQIERGFGRIRPYIARDVNAVTHTLEMLGSLSERCHSVEQLQILASEVESLVTLARVKIDEPLLERVECQAKKTRGKFLTAIDSCRQNGEPAAGQRPNLRSGGGKNSARQDQ